MKIKYLLFLFIILFGFNVCAENVYYPKIDKMSCEACEQTISLENSLLFSPDVYATHECGNYYFPYDDRCLLRITKSLEFERGIMFICDNKINKDTIEFIGKNYFNQEQYSRNTGCIEKQFIYQTQSEVYLNPGQTAYVFYNKGEMQTSFSQETSGFCLFSEDKGRLTQTGCDLLDVQDDFVWLPDDTYDQDLNLINGWQDPANVFSGVDRQADENNIYKIKGLLYYKDGDNFCEIVKGIDNKLYINQYKCTKDLDITLTSGFANKVGYFFERTTDIIKGVFT